MARTSVATRKTSSSKLNNKTRLSSAVKAVTHKTLHADEMAAGGSAAERHQMIKVAAYYLAEQRGFAGGDPMIDWLAAEAEIDEMLKDSGVRLIH